MNKSLSFFVAGLLIGGLCSTVFFTWYVRNSASASDGKTVLKLGHGLDTAHPVHKAMEYMGERLSELSGGTVELQIYPGSVLGSETQCIEQLQNGDLALTKTSAAALENFETIYSVFGMPYIFRDEDHYWKVINGPIGKDMLHKAVSNKILGLCYYDAGSRNFYTVSKPILAPDDMKNMKLRVMNSPTAIRMIECMGGSPTPIAWGELYTALGQGTVVGAENNMPSFTSNKHYEVCKHFTNNAHCRIPDVLCISTLIWDELSPQEQSWLAQAAQESSDYQRTLWQEMTLESVELAKAEGVTIYEVDQQLFADKVKPMYDEIKDEKVRELINAIREVK
ncbi:MAG: TRAP transporter substrate-binding protein [Sedimentisphaerales bacterium]|nr:TRAP transporter substrate-binding protein [Sedimentisphaerales bacterium]